MEKSKKISSKIEFIGTCPNSSVSPKGILGPLGANMDTIYFLLVGAA